MVTLYNTGALMLN